MDHQVTPEEAVPNTIAVDINSKYYLAGHWGTLSSQSVKIPGLGRSPLLVFSLTLGNSDPAVT